MNYVILFISFLIGQFAYTSITVYGLSRNSNTPYFEAFLAYIKKEVGFLFLGFVGFLILAYIMSDFIDINVKREDLKNKELLTMKEMAIFYFRTISLCLGAFSQHLLLLAFKRGKNEVENLNKRYGKRG